MSELTGPCVICGREEYGKLDSEHRCNPKTLAAIDRAMKQDRTVPREPSFSERLSTGFFLLRMGEQ